MCDCPSPTGHTMCHCAACHRYFTGPTAFTEHQTVGPPSGVVCHDPAERGLVVLRTTANGVELWGRAGHWAPGRIAALRDSA
jgi:hypothetical protein